VCVCVKGPGERLEEQTAATDIFLDEQQPTEEK